MVLGSVKSLIDCSERKLHVCFIDVAETEQRGKFSFSLFSQRLHANVPADKHVLVPAPHARHAFFKIPRLTSAGFHLVVGPSGPSCTHGQRFLVNLIGLFNAKHMNQPEPAVEPFHPPGLAANEGAPKILLWNKSTSWVRVVLWNKLKLKLKEKIHTGDDISVIQHHRYWFFFICKGFHYLTVAENTKVPIIRVT